MLACFPPEHVTLNPACGACSPIFHSSMYRESSQDRKTGTGDLSLCPTKPVGMAQIAGLNSKKDTAKGRIPF